MLNSSRAKAAALGFGALLVGSIAPAAAQTARVSATARTLSAFEMAKAELMLYDKLPCLGCHELGGQGGRIGPSLSRLKVTRAPDYVFSMIGDPQATVPGTVMPRVPLVRKYSSSSSSFDFVLGPDGETRVRAEGETISESTLELIAGYLLQREPSSENPPAELFRPAPRPLDDGIDAETLYGHFCADCHGENGEGDGPNAEFLPVQPVSHADPSYMSERPDDSLFDAIYSGGYIMDLSQMMPPYGRTLDREQIWSLVRYLRELCDCQGPEWSRDGR
jgi:mono/diheme cytochrome c family protein